MSKSLNNFVTVNDFLKNEGTARYLRILFLIHSWYKLMDLTTNAIEEVKAIDRKIVDFIANITSLVKTSNKTITKYNLKDNEFLKYIILMKKDINVTMLNNVDTMTIIDLIMNAINTTYKYVKTEFNISLVSNIFNHIMKILDVFGLEYNNDDHNTNDSDKFIDIIADFRIDIRSKVKEHIKIIPKNVTNELFTILDDVRD